MQINRSMFDCLFFFHFFLATICKYEWEIEVNNSREDSRAYLIKMTGDRTALKMTKQRIALTPLRN